MNGEPERRLELTLRIWRSGSRRQFEKYVRMLLRLLPDHGARAERRAQQVAAGRANPDAVLVLSFPDGDAVEGFFTDPRRDDLEDLAARAVARSLITSGRMHEVRDYEPVDVTELPRRPTADSG